MVKHQELSGSLDSARFLQSRKLLLFPSQPCCDLSNGDFHLKVDGFIVLMALRVIYNVETDYNEDEDDCAQGMPWVEMGEDMMQIV